ncbi:hypothetical protein TURU_129759 [Turdus rufiventris]|nr:hypothetical protein TURU_129759 [Turdus rufiventris]
MEWLMRLGMIDLEERKLGGNLVALHNSLMGGAARSYQHEDHYCTQQTLSALQSVFEDGQQSASRIRE